MAAVDPSEFFCDSVEVFSAEWSDKSNSPGSRECAICGAPSNGFHFNAPSCSACAAFFRRTVTLDRNFVCNHQNNCRVNYTLRVICRACRYAKCIATGMERGAVQPRRDSNIGRRKLVFANHKFGSQQKKVVVANQSYPAKQMDVLAAAMDFSGMSPEIHYAQSFSSSEGIPSPKLSLSSLSLQDMDAEKLLDDLMKEERLVNERRKLLYCTRSSIYNLLSTATLNDIPFSKDDLVELTFVEIQKHIRPQILITYEWIRGWRHFNLFNTRDRLNFLRHCVLYHSIIDPAYLTFRLGLPGRFVMFNGMYVSTEDKNDEGWRDEGGFISAELKKSLYWPLMERVLKEVCAPMKSLNLTFVEFVILKSLVSFKSACCSDLPPELKTLMNLHLDVLFKALNIHYVSIGLSKEDIAERTGNIVLMMSSVFVVGMECLESHHKIQFFDLWQLDDLLLKLISPEPENSKPV